MSIMIKKDSKGKVYPDLTSATMSELLNKKFKDDFDLEACIEENRKNLRKYKIDEEAYYLKAKRNKN